MNNQLTRRADKRNPTVQITPGARQGNPLGERSIAMDTQFTASQHLNGPGHLS